MLAELKNPRPRSKRTLLDNAWEKKETGDSFSPEEYNVLNLISFNILPREVLIIPLSVLFYV